MAAFVHGLLSKQQERMKQQQQQRVCHETKGTTELNEPLPEQQQQSVQQQDQQRHAIDSSSTLPHCTRMPGSSSVGDQRACVVQHMLPATLRARALALLPSAGQTSLPLPTVVPCASLLCDVERKQPGRGTHADAVRDETTVPRLYPQAAPSGWDVWAPVLPACAGHTGSQAVRHTAAPMPAPEAGHCPPQPASLVPPSQWPRPPPPPPLRPTAAVDAATVLLAGCMVVPAEHLPYTGWCEEADADGA